jgi:drug/metabolite transporter (DMT)-like permease
MIVYLLGLLSPFAFGLGTVLQQRGTLETAASEGDLRFLAQIVRKPVWLAGGLVTVCGFGLQAAALHYGSLALVQSLQTLSLVFALPLGVLLSGQRIDRRSAVGAGTTVVGLAVFTALGQPGGGIPAPRGANWLISGAIAAAIVVLLSWLALRRRGASAAALFGTTSGVCFAVQLAATKLVATQVDQGIPAVLSSWAVYALIVSAVIGFVLQQASLKTGSLAPAMASLNAATLVVSVAFALLVFEEKVSAGEGRVVPAVVGLAMAVLGVVLLAFGRHQHSRLVLK